MALKVVVVGAQYRCRWQVRLIHHYRKEKEKSTEWNMKMTWMANPNPFMLRFNYLSLSLTHAIRLDVIRRWIFRHINKQSSLSLIMEKSGKYDNRKVPDKHFPLVICGLGLTLWLLCYTTRHAFICNSELSIAPSIYFGLSSSPLSRPFVGSLFALLLAMWMEQFRTKEIIKMLLIFVVVSFVVLLQVSVVIIVQQRLLHHCQARSRQRFFFLSELRS